VEVNLSDIKPMAVPSCPGEFWTKEGF